LAAYSCTTLELQKPIFNLRMRITTLLHIDRSLSCRDSFLLIPYTLFLCSQILHPAIQVQVRRSVSIAEEKLEALPSTRVLLKALLNHAPTTGGGGGVDVIAKDIIEASEEEDGLVQLARFTRQV
jgi:hypothetical protein